jgi:hypothetical protein
MKKKLVRITEEDAQNIMNSTEFVINLTRRLKAKFERKSVFIEESILLPMIRESLLLYLTSRKRIRFESEIDKKMR